MNGFVNIIKPKDMSSALAVMLIKKKIRQQFGKQSIGHMGTLDPMAQGVLPMGINQANRLFDYLLDKTKVYVAEFTFGYETDTLDITGNKINTSDIIPSKEQIESILSDFVGEIDQVPPKYSAKNIEGKRGYELARAGVEFELQPKKVTVLSFELIKQIDKYTFEFKISCKGGTYIRSLCRDLAHKLDTFAVMSKLDRQECGFFTIKNAVKLQQFIDCEDISSFIIPPDAVIAFPQLNLSENQSKKLLNGVFDAVYDVADGLYRVYSVNDFWGIGEVIDKRLKMKSYVRDL